MKHYDFQIDDWRQFRRGPQPRHTYADEVMRDHPTGYWRLGDAGPAALRDISGQAHNAAAVGNVQFQAPGALTADADHGLTLNGDGSHVAVPSMAVPAGDNPRTFEVWANVGETAAVDTFLSYGVAEPGCAVIAHLAVDTFAINLVGHRLQAVNLGLQGWHHVVLCFPGPGHDSSAWRLWIDGQPVSLYDADGSPLPMNTAPGVLRLGSDLTHATGWNGSMDEFALFHRALPPPRIHAHYRRAMANH